MVSEILRGETVIVRQSYNLFENELDGEEGVYIRTNEETGKHLVYFPQFEEWGEPKEVERKNPGIVTQENQEFIERVRQLEFKADEKQRLFNGFSGRK